MTTPKKSTHKTHTKPPQRNNSFHSSTIADYLYDPNLRKLMVTFKSGGLYVYDGVSQQRVNAFHAAKSKGKFLASHIKPNYKATKIG